MCGITGIFDTRGAGEISRELLHRMNETQFHRGPDEGGLHLEPGVGLGHRRLSIIDLSTGQQPLFNEDGSVVVVFNGEIYNFQQLVPELEALGHSFRTHSDTEVIVHAWEAWGRGCVERFRGMFAFVLWDRKQETLFVVRDRFGVKPLYYAFLDNGEFVFGSELKSLMVHPKLTRDIDPLAVEEYFAYGYVPEPRTIFRRVNKLPPGFTVTLKRGQARALPRQYWDMPFTPVVVKDEASAMDELVERMKESVRLRMIADVPLGAFLSGGVDFSVVGQLAQVYDEPYADSSALPTYRVCELARKHVKVALSGDGGDEHFAGYRRYRWFRYEERLRAAMPLMMRRPLFGALGRMYPKADWAPKVLRAKTTFEALARDTVEGYFHGVSLLSDAQRKQLFSRSFKRQLQGYQAVEVLRRHAAVAPIEDALSLVQYLDMKTYLVGDILTKVDRASMAHALEVREPLLDHELMGWVSGLPTDFKLNGTEGKYLLKKARQPYLPHDVLYRKKMGFSVPLAAWFRGSLAATIRNVVLGERLASTGLFNQHYLREVVEAHQSGRRDYSVVLWTVLMFDAFLGQVLGIDEVERQAA